MMTDDEKERITNLNRCFRRALQCMKAPEDLTVSEWAEKYRRLSAETSAEPGKWRTSRTPYLKEIMDSFTDPKVHDIVMVSSSQIGKSEMEMNCLGYIIDQDPGSILYVHPTVDDARKFSRLRISPMIRDTPPLKKKVRDFKTKESGNTILQKSFPGGMLTITGSNSPSALASTPARYIIGDEMDRWSEKAGREGDPWLLAKARQTTFYNAKAIQVSTPTVKGASRIDTAYHTGTQERWCHRCPECGEYSEIKFNDIKFDPVKKTVNRRIVWDINGDPLWMCPKCGTVHDENEMRKQPAKWVATNPDAYENGVRSFWLNAFASPWTPWERIVLRFLESKDDPERLKVVYNTLLGQLWEARGDISSEDDLINRREDYGQTEDGTPIELPDGVLCLTCGVDTQDNRLEYEVVGHGQYGETWGITRGAIMGSPDTDDVWERLDGIAEHVYRYKDGTGIKVSIVCVDSGGHFTQDVYKRCAERQSRYFFAIKGRGGDGVPYVSPPTQVPIRDDKRRKCWLYTLGVDSGKASIMADLKVEEPGPKYCHFPLGIDRGYDEFYFNGLLSEKLTLTHSGGVDRWRWEKIPGHERNEPLDCRNYAMAALKILNPDLDRIEQSRKQKTEPVKEPDKPKPRKRTRRAVSRKLFDDW